VTGYFSRIRYFIKRKYQLSTILQMSYNTVKKLSYIIHFDKFREYRFLS